MKTYFETQNRRLEHFFFLHGIDFEEQFKAPDGMNVWRYCLDEEGRRVLEEWRTIKARQAAARKEAEA